mmetsp:Transcript_101888/g.202291  ORF Transcript_101888/g.202291 Transcript_101888/m.202291 type:complete len:124 (-) Transcript_101888:614-985(-)
MEPQSQLQPTTKMTTTANGRLPDQSATAFGDAALQARCFNQPRELRTKITGIATTTAAAEATAAAPTTITRAAIAAAPASDRSQLHTKAFTTLALIRPLLLMPVTSRPSLAHQAVGKHHQARH